MERAGSDLTAFGETVVFLDYFKDLPDPRQAGKVIYPLPKVLLLCLLAVLAGAETFVDIARFGEKKIALLRRFRPFCHGTPAHDHLGDILSVLDAERSQERIQVLPVEKPLVLRTPEGRLRTAHERRRVVRNQGDLPDCALV